jgi:hypothetical protein
MNDLGPPSRATMADARRWMGMFVRDSKRHAKAYGLSLEEYARIMQVILDEQLGERPPMRWRGSRRLT